MNIILLGCGYAGNLHLKCYQKLQDIMELNIVGAVDIDQKKLKKFQTAYNKSFNNKKEPLYANNLNEISKHLDISDCVIDICTPNDTHYLCAKEACNLGAKKIIIEKPLSSSISDMKKIEKLDAIIAVAENYIYSKTTKHIKELLDNNGFKPLFIRTEFSKDRRTDSLNKRGCINGKHPHVFTVEIPHQLAVVSYLFGAPSKIYGAWVKDMLVADQKFYEHGEGAIYLAHEKDIVSYNLSCLEGHKHLSNRYREIHIHCEDDIRIIGSYPIGGNDTVLYSEVSVHNNGSVSTSYKLHDDSMLETLKEILECFDNNEIPITNVTFGKKIVELISKGTDIARGYT